MKKITHILSSLLIAGILVSACGESEQQKDAQQPKQEEKQEEKKADEPLVEQEVVEITIKAQGDDMANISYDKEEIEVVEGSKIRITLVNESKTKGMPHNMVVVTFGEGKRIADAGVKAGQDNEFVPKDDKDVIAYSPLAEIQETVTFEFEAPEVGSYHYICTYPGHFPKMFGTLNVVEY